ECVGADDGQRLHEVPRSHGRVGPNSGCRYPSATTSSSLEGSFPDPPKKCHAWRASSLLPTTRSERACADTEEHTMDTKRLIVGLAAAVLLTGGAAGVVGPGIAQASRGPMPLSGAWP